MRSIRALLVLSLLVACSREDPALRRADGTMFSSSGGEVSLADGSHLQFAITSQRYKQWENARSGLSRSTAARFGQILQPKSPTQHTIDRAVAYLESNPAAKQSIERSGMSVKDFVLMTVALEQEMRLASGQSTTRSEREPIPESYPYPLDTVPQPTTPVPMPLPQPTPIARSDTVRRDSVVPPPRTDSVKRDTVKRDTVSKPPRDTTPDSMAPRSR